MQPTTGSGEQLHRGKPRLAVMDRQVPWSKFKGKKAWVGIENRVDGDFPVVSRHMAQQGIEVLGWDDWAQADVLVEHHRGHGSAGPLREVRNGFPQGLPLSLVGVCSKE